MRHKVPGQGMQQAVRWVIAETAASLPTGGPRCVECDGCPETLAAPSFVGVHNSRNRGNVADRRSSVR
jgi:hypothetical protein